MQNINITNKTNTPSSIRREHFNFSIKIHNKVDSFRPWMSGTRVMRRHLKNIIRTIIRRHYNYGKQVLTDAFNRSSNSKYKHKAAEGQWPTKKNKINKNRTSRTSVLGSCLDSKLSRSFLQH